MVALCLLCWLCASHCRSSWVALSGICLWLVAWRVAGNPSLGGFMLLAFSALPKWAPAQFVGPWIFCCRVFCCPVGWTVFPHAAWVFWTSGVVGLLCVAVFWSAQRGSLGSSSGRAGSTAWAVACGSFCSAPLYLSGWDLRSFVLPAGWLQPWCAFPSPIPCCRPLLPVRSPSL